MKKMWLALVLVSGAAFQVQAATVAAPLFGCRLDAAITSTTSSVEVIIFRDETVAGNGKVVCVDAVGQKMEQNVNITITSGGIGPAYNGPLQGLQILAVRAGGVTVDGMAGEYNLGVGPRLGLINARVGVMAGVQVSGNGVGLGVEAVIEDRMSIGLDLGGMYMTVVPTTALHSVR